MKIGLASDSMGNAEALLRALEMFAAQGVDRVFFLGGRYSDVDAVGAGSGDRDAVKNDFDFLAAVEGELSRQAEGRGGKALAAKVVRVASKACPEYHAGTAPRKLLEMVDGFICCLAHDKGDFDRDDIANATVLFHGNSSQAGLVQIGPRCFVTPGHLRAAPPEGKPATFAVVALEPGQIELMVHDALTGREVRREAKAFGARSKVSVL